MSVGSWVRNHPKMLEAFYQATHRFIKWLAPLARRDFLRADRWLRGPEKLSKELIFDCKMCGQCILHSTGMTCSMTCPKNLRNGPCGGVRQDGNCEVYPDMPCIWVEAVENSMRMPTFGDEIMVLQPPLNRKLEGSSAWINMLSGEDIKVPQGWELTVYGHR